LAGPIRISILANASQARREMNSVAGDASGLGSKLGKFGKIAGAAVAGGLVVAGAAAVKFGADSVKAASDAQQSIGATETVFGKSAKSIIDNSNRAAQAVGLSANQYRENANIIGSLFANKGLKGNELAKQTDLVIKKGADLSATFGGTATEAVDALSSALKGEFDPLERYGVSLKASTISTEAAALAQKKYGKDLKSLTTAQQDAIQRQAAMKLINEQSAKTQGAFGRETDTLAHQQQVLAAQFENVKAKVGAALLPVLTKLLTFMNANLGPAFTAVANFLRPLVDRFRALFDGASQGQGKLAPLVSFFQTSVVPAVQGIVDAFKGLVAVVLPIVQQVAAAIMANWGKIQPQVQAIWASVQQIITSALSIIKSVVTIVTGVISAVWQRFGGTILKYITTTMTNVATVLKGAFQIIAGIFKVVSSLLKGDWKGAWNGIKQIVSGALSVIKGVVSQAMNVIKTVVRVAWGVIKAATSATWNGIKAVISGVWNGIKALVSGAVNGVKALVTGGWNAVKSGTTAAWNGIKSALSSAWTSIKNAVTSGISGVTSLVRGLPGKITGALGNLGSLLYNAGRDIIQGLLDGLESMIGAVTDKLGALTDKIPDWKGPRDRDKKLLRPAGRLIIKGLVDGFTDGERGVEKSLKALTARIREALDKKYDGKELAKRTKAVMKSLADEYRAMEKNGKAQDRLSSKLAEARKRVEELRKAAKEYAASVRDSIVATGDVTALGQQEDGSVSITSLLDQLKNKVADAKRYSDLVQRLTAQGLNQTTVSQLLAAGAEGGLATAEALASGGQAAVDEVNQLTSQLTTSGQQLGNAMSDEFHSAGINAAAALVRGLEKDSAALDRAAKRLAETLAKAVRKALGIKSPSRVFMDIGDNVTKGLTIGLDDTYVRRSAAALAASLEQGFGKPALESYASQNAAGASQGSVQVTLSAQQLSDLEQGRKIQMKLDAYRAAGGRSRA
jgi:phage-related protein